MPIPNPTAGFFAGPADPAPGSWGAWREHWDRMIGAILGGLAAAPRVTVEIDAAGLAVITAAAATLDGLESADVDTLTRISLDLPEGRIVALTTSQGKTITIEHGAAGDGGIDLHGDADAVLSTPTAVHLVQRVGNRWVEMRPPGGIQGVQSVIRTIDGASYTLGGDDAFLTAPNGVLTITTLRVRHNSDPSTPVAITQPDSLPAGVIFQLHQADDQVGAVTISRESSGQINGQNAVSLAGAGSSAWLVVLTAGPARSVLEGETAEAADMGGQPVVNHASGKVSLSGTQTLDAAAAPAGATVVNTGSAATWTLPSRLGSAETGTSIQLVILNRGAGTITFSASGPTLKGAASLAADKMATVVWEHSGSTEFVWVAST